VFGCSGCSGSLSRNVSGWRFIEHHAVGGYRVMMNKCEAPRPEGPRPEVPEVWHLGLNVWGPHALGKCTWRFY